MIPKPFSRPSVAINHTGRRWVETHARNLTAGDVVPDKGKIGAYRATKEETLFVFASGNTETYRNDEIVFAFTLGESVGISE